jgi:hypothetical protein
MQRRSVIVSVVKRASNEPDELKILTKQSSRPDPFLISVLSVQDLSFLKPSSGKNYQVFSQVFCTLFYLYKLIILLWTTKFNGFNTFDPFGSVALTQCRMNFNPIPVSGFKMRSLVRSQEIPTGFGCKWSARPPTEWVEMGSGQRML